MFTYPKILENPNNPKYNLEEYEIYSIKECSELISINKHSYAIFALWSAIIVNLQRRVEFFGIEIFLKNIDSKDNFDVEGNTLKDRWLNINEFKILRYCRKINLINHVSNSLLETVFWLKSNIDELEHKNLSQEEILALIFLIEKNLFEKEFKSDMRGKDPLIKNSKIKFRRKDDMKSNSTGIPNTHHNLLMRSGVKLFEENNKPNNPKNNLIDKYC